MKARIEKEDLLIDFKQGASLLALRQKYVLPRSTIHSWITRAGLKYPQRVKKENPQPKYKIKLTKEAKAIILSEYKEGARIPFLCKKYGMCESRVYIWMKREGLKTRKDKREYGKVKETIFLLKGGYTVKEIMAKINVTESSVRSICFVNKIKPMKAVLVGRQKINDGYFENIDTPNKAYFLGLLFADGCVHEKIDRISISLIEQDVYLIEALKEELETSYKISRYQPKMPNAKAAFSFQFYSNQIKNDLIRHGCTPNKSLTLKFPEISDNMFWHFFRGCFDGDGHVSIKKYKNGLATNKIGLTSSYSFNLRLRHILLERFGIASCFSFPKPSGCTNLIISNRDYTKEMFGFMYNDGGIFMSRKKNKFIF